MLGKFWFIFILTYASYCVLYITRKNFSIVKMLIQKDLDLSTAFLGTIDTLFLGSYAAFQILLPPLSDIYGNRLLLLFSYFGAGIFSLLFSYSSYPFVLIFLWLLEGISHASVFPILIKMLSCNLEQENSKKQKSNETLKILGWWMTSQQIGGILATVVITYYTNKENHASWRISFRAAGYITLMMAIIFYLILPEKQVNHWKKQAELHTSEAGIGGKKLFDVELTQVVHQTSRVDNLAIDPEQLNHFRENLDMGRAQSSCKILHNPQGISQPTMNQYGSNQSNALHGSEKNCPDAAYSFTAQMKKSVNIHPPSMARILSSSHVVSCSLAYFCVKFVRYALIFWLPYFFVMQYRFSPKKAAYSSVVYEIGGIIGSMLTGWITSRVFKGKRLKATAALCACAGFCILNLTWLHYNVVKTRQSALLNIPMNTLNSEMLDRPLTTWLYLNVEKEMLVIIFILGMILAGPDTILGASAALYLCDILDVPYALSTLAGTINGIGGLGGVVQGYFIAKTADVFGWTTVFLLLSVTCFLSSFTLLLGRLS